jgi:hypothetical protein
VRAAEVVTLLAMTPQMQNVSFEQLMRKADALLRDATRLRDDFAMLNQAIAGRSDSDHLLPKRKLEPQS